jgi:hypothetical protein
MIGRGPLQRGDAVRRARAMTTTRFPPAKLAHKLLSGEDPSTLQLASLSQAAEESPFNKPQAAGGLEWHFARPSVPAMPCLICCCAPPAKPPWLAGLSSYPNHHLFPSPNPVQRDARRLRTMAADRGFLVANCAASCASPQSKRPLSRSSLGRRCDGRITKPAKPPHPFQVEARPCETHRRARRCVCP